MNRKNESLKKETTKGKSIFSKLVKRFLLSHAQKGYSPVTVQNYETDLKRFENWLAGRGLETLNSISRKTILAYQRYISQYKKIDGKPLAIENQIRRLSVVMGFFSWCLKHNHVLFNPASDLELPKRPDRLPGNILTIDEAEKILSLPDISTSAGLRDRSIMELFYATGLRRNELVYLKLNDIDFEKELIFVDQGKQNKDRYVPVSQRALFWLAEYLEKSRPLYDADNSQIVFLSSTGKAFRPRSLARRVREYIKKADIGKTGSCHIFRHTLATLMLENGANLRYIQEILGHCHLQTTQIYTRVSIAKLKEVHNRTHPAK